MYIFAAIKLTFFVIKNKILSFLALSSFLTTYGIDRENNEMFYKAGWCTTNNRKRKKMP